jgi:hypothetical protein
MAAAKPVTNFFQIINNIQHGISGSVTPRNEIPMATPTFLGPGTQWLNCGYCTV